MMDTGPDEKNGRWRSFSGWMAALARISVGLFALMAIYTLAFDVSALNWTWNYALWSVMGVSIVAGFLSMGTEGR
jgi:hypothetical protein